MAELSVERRREIRERLRRLEGMPPQSIVFNPEEIATVGQSLDALETAEAELRLARELLRRMILGENRARYAAMAFTHPESRSEWAEDNREALAAIRRDVEEGRDGG